MPNIARCDGEIVLQCSRDELAVLDRHRRMTRHDPSPLVDALLIEGKDARVVAQRERSEPRFEAGSIMKACRRLFSIPFLISPSVITLKNRSVDGTDPSQIITWALGLSERAPKEAFLPRVPAATEAGQLLGRWARANADEPERRQLAKDRT